MIPPLKTWRLRWKRGISDTRPAQRAPGGHTTTTLCSRSLPPRFLVLHSAVIRTTVLIQHYCVALMVVSGRVGDSDHLHKHTSVETLEITQSLLTAAQQCPSRHGHMVLLRIPSTALADWAFRQLCRVRRQLGLEHAFEIILGNPNQPLNIGQSFVDQIKVNVTRRLVFYRCVQRFSNRGRN